MANAPTVLFVCLHGSAKSVIAERHFERLAAERRVEARVASAGVEPDASVPRLRERMLAFYRREEQRRSSSPPRTSSCRSAATSQDWEARSPCSAGTMSLR